MEAEACEDLPQGPEHPGATLPAGTTVEKGLAATDATTAGSREDYLF